MGKAITKIVYKPDTQSSDEYLIIVNPEEVCHTFYTTRFNPLILCSCSSRNTRLEVSFALAASNDTFS